MRDYQNNEQSDLAAIIRLFSSKSCAFAHGPLVRDGGQARRRPPMFSL
jgi:hypothetical protein